MDLKEFFQGSAILASGYFVYQQIKNSNKQKEKDYDYKRKEKAIEMAIIFQEMLMDISYIVSILEKTKIKEIYQDKIKFNELQKFDYDELVNRLGEKVIKEIKDIDLLEGISILDIAKTYIGFNYANENFLKLYDNRETKKISILIINDFLEKKAKVLNKLEWFSMNFTSGLADESVVYQSLHQVYLSSVKLFHFEISMKNREGTKDKYYCNIIELYNNWSDHYDKALEKEEKAKKEFQRKMNDNVRKPEKFNSKS